MLPATWTRPPLVACAVAEHQPNTFPDPLGSAGFDQNCIVIVEGTEFLTNSPLLGWD